MLNIEIDGKSTQVDSGRTVMDAARQLGIYIPHFCYHRKLSIAANCRMCLVQVEKAPKPLPACATPVTEGMKVQTHSAQAVKAQKGVMEFLLINHPLDCPICDQGGECQLQDLAVGYGGSASRYEEDKRVVLNKELGPLINTDMTRCIHCTRCVRFGQEVAGIMELGMAGRGEHSEILSFMGRTVDSELSGNVIDLCPVGALTSKPFRYSARTWELRRHRSVSPHDGLGANLTVQVKQNRVMRVLPAENEAVNECWLADRDRFSYQGLNSADRLARPMIRKDGVWREVDWQQALEFVATGLRATVQRRGPAALGALASPHQTLEELFLLQRLTRALGSGNVDHRLRQADFSLDASRPRAPWLGRAVASLSTLGSALLIGSNPRPDHPLLAARLRTAAKAGARVCLIGLNSDDPAMPIAGRIVSTPARLVDSIAEVLVAVAEHQSRPLDGALAQRCARTTPGTAARAIAEALVARDERAVLIGNTACHHPRYAEIQWLARAIADRIGATYGTLGEAANTTGGYAAGALPYAGPAGADATTGLNAAQMFEKSLAAYVLLGVEPEFDCQNPHAAAHALASAEFVVTLSPFRHGAERYAHAMLPIAPFTETAGTFVNTEGTVQSFNGCVAPFGETRPGWKVLRVLANLLDVPGFDYDTVEDVRGALATDLAEFVRSTLDTATAGVPSSAAADEPALELIAEVPNTRADALVRRAEALQSTRDARAPTARLHPDTAAKHGLAAGVSVRLRQGDASFALPVELDPATPVGAVRVAAAHPETAGMGPSFGPVELETLG